MRLRIYDDDGRDVVLMDHDRPEEFIGSVMTLGEDRAIQLAERLRADEVEPFFRGNAQCRRTLNVWRRHETNTKAALFVEEHRSEVPGVGTAELRFNDGGSSFTRYFTKVAVARVELQRRIGVATHWRYDMIFTGITNRRPN
jgi:hypothetical protein